MGGAWAWIRAGGQKPGKDPINHLTSHFAEQLMNFELICGHQSSFTLTNTSGEQKVQNRSSRTDGNLPLQLKTG